MRSFRGIESFKKFDQKGVKWYWNLGVYTKGYAACHEISGHGVPLDPDGLRTDRHGAEWRPDWQRPE